MNKFEEALNVVETICGNGKDNVIALSTIDFDQSKRGNPYPCVRDVDAHYEDGKFYITTWLETRKMKQITQCEEVGFSVNMEGFYGRGIGRNLGWVLAKENTQLREKLKKTFADWYEHANNEQSENCVILEIEILSGTVMQDHGAVHYEIDFVNKSAV